ncbi:MAG: zinc ribbon domain-containing protein [Methyloprofundus sp.]|nr:zinc ribbon domain-containing protein [Methyloprofundus sp.]
MSSESLFTECKNCGKKISKSIRACPQCGTKQKKLTVIHWIGIVFLGFIIVSVINAPENSSIDTSVKTQKSFEDSVREAVFKKLKLDFSWGKEGFGSIMIANFAIVNNSEYDIKDIEIMCAHYAKSGTKIDSNERKIYEIVKANSTKSFANFNMGFIHEQVISSSCQIKDFTVII